MKFQLQLILAICMALFPVFVTGTEPDKKQVNAVLTSASVKIDGSLNEDDWNNAPIATNFFQVEPYNGKPSGQNTNVRFLYDNHALYIGAELLDSAPDSIKKQLGKRDEMVIADYFGVFIDPFNDGLNAYGFIVSAAGVQADMKTNDTEGDDLSWDAVWDSEITITEKGWTVEMRIPYSALRFAKKDVQIWGLNILRVIPRLHETCSWNFIDKTVNGMTKQSGELLGLKDIKPPLRLSTTPYFSTYIQNNSENNAYAYSIKGGLDVKYGINESFTLDMMLIPDFGQVQSDDEVLNLSPFEMYYSEKRQFFMEGTELFNKGGIFYSRRIGAKPVNYYDVEDDLKENEQIKKNPGEGQLLNATKLTGKTKHGLGVGLLNAMSLPSYAEITDTSVNLNRRYKTQSFTNYNLLVFSQSLKNNSYVSIINTNVLRHSDDYVANVTAGEFLIGNNSKSYAINGKGGVSQIYSGKEQEVGHFYELELLKTSGNFIFSLEHQVESDKYNPNDMGYLQSNNEFRNELDMEYNIFNPFWRFMYLYNKVNISLGHLYNPRKFTDFSINANIFGTFKNYLSVFLFAGGSPVTGNDYYEPRVTGRFYKTDKYLTTNIFFSSDYKKRFALDIGFGKFTTNIAHKNGYNYSIEPRLRVNDKLMIIYQYNFRAEFNTNGFVDKWADDDTIVFGRRNVQTHINTLNINYSFNNKSSLSFRMRHYWSKAFYKDYSLLNTNGELNAYNDYTENNNINYNAFNIDMVYTWNFAPGSEISVVWKNSISGSEDFIIPTYSENLDKTFHSPQINSVSFKVLYYLDYQYLKTKNH